jgi:hypothetical protein
LKIVVTIEGDLGRYRDEFRLPLHLRFVEDDMLTICWAAKGGSGTTVYAVARALAITTPTVLVDLAGDAMTVLGLPRPDGPGIHDWLRSDAGPDRLARLEHPATELLSVVPAGRHDPERGGRRWFELGAHLRTEPRRVIVDAGTGRPPDALVAAAEESLLVTRACYLALTRAGELGARPTGIVVVEEPGRRLGSADIEASLGAPIVATALLDPAIARAVDAGLLVSRLPSAWRRQLRRAA